MSYRVIVWDARQALFPYFGPLLAALLLVACDWQTMMEPFIPKDEARVAQQYLEYVRTRNFVSLETRFDPAYRYVGLRPKLEKMAALFPQEAPKSIKVVGTNTFIMQGSTTYNLTFEMEFSHQWLIGNVAIKKVGKTEFIETIGVYQIANSLENINAVTFTNKPFASYAFLALAIEIPIFVIFTLIAAIRTPIPKRKWLWIVFILFSIGQITINWTSGVIAYRLLAVQLLGSGFVQAPYGPLMLQIGFPLGAIIFWIRHKQWKNQLKSQTEFSDTGEQI